VTTLRYDRTYRTSGGWLVRVVPGAKIHRISDRGTLDRRVIDVRSTERPELSWTEPIDRLEEVPS
jgi:hypothetical protein